MDVSSLGSLSSALTQAQAGSDVGMALLKKAIDLDAQSALQLLQAVPQVASNPPNLGNNVDVKA